MLLNSPPPRFTIAFASGAGGGFIRPIPQPSQIGIQNGAASLTDGFPPLNFQPVAAGGVPPFGEDFNGLLNQITLWNQWQEAGAPVRYDATFATGGSGGYPQGAILTSNIVNGNRWLSLIDSNTADPDSLTQTTWTQDPGSISTGTPVPSFSSTVPQAYVAANTLTVGNAASNATGLASSVTQLLYRFIWLNFSNSACPIFTSGGSPSTRGANPDADFAANKAIATPDLRGRGLIGVDTMGGPATTRLAGVPVSLGNNTSPTSILGENLHVLVTGELAAHSHANTLTDPTHTHGLTTVAGGIAISSAGGSEALGSGGNSHQALSALLSVNNASTGITITNVNSGGNAAHNNVEQSVTVYWNLKL